MSCVQRAIAAKQREVATREKAPFAALLRRCLLFGACRNNYQTRHNKMFQSPCY